MDATDRETAITRLTLGAMGAFAGLAAWMLADVLPDRMRDLPRVYLFLASLTGVFFTACLALAGPLRPVRAVLMSVSLAVPVSGLFTWAGLRFDKLPEFFDTDPSWAAPVVLTLVPLPFFIAKARDAGWRDYPALFAHSWDIVVRYAAAWLFVGVVWGVMMLSDALLRLVGIDIINWLLERDAVPYVLTGVTLGIALAVVNELSDYVSPYLVLRLLRLLLPVVLVVVVIFLAALPFRGLSHLFGTFSAATTLLAMAMGAATLITTALDADETREVSTSAMRGGVQLLSLLVPALAGLAGVAVWMRVRQYGWTPDRLAAATLAALVLCYGAAYAVAVLRRHDWGGRIRRANIRMAWVVMAVAVLWMTPLVNPERIATASQIARIRAGHITADQLDLWAIGREWGRAGQAGLKRLAEMTDHPEAARLSERLAVLATADDRGVFIRGSIHGYESIEAAEVIQQVAAVLPVRPAGATLPPRVLQNLRLWELQGIDTACALRTAAGNPGCVAVVAELDGRRTGPEVVLAARQEDDRVMIHYFQSTEADGYNDMVSYRTDRDNGAMIDALIAGEFTIDPLPLNTLSVGGQPLVPIP